MRLGIRSIYTQQPAHINSAIGFEKDFGIYTLYRFPYLLDATTDQFRMSIYIRLFLIRSLGVLYTRSECVLTNGLDIKTIGASGA
jgi:hypothetical protein